MFERIRAILERGGTTRPDCAWAYKYGFICDNAEDARKAFDAMVNSLENCPDFQATFNAEIKVGVRAMGGGPDRAIRLQDMRHSLAKQP